MRLLIVLAATLLIAGCATKPKVEPLPEIKKQQIVLKIPPVLLEPPEELKQL